MLIRGGRDEKGKDDCVPDAVVFVLVRKFTGFSIVKCDSDDLHIRSIPLPLLQRGQPFPAIHHGFRNALSGVHLLAPTEI